MIRSSEKISNLTELKGELKFCHIDLACSTQVHHFKKIFGAMTFTIMTFRITVPCIKTLSVVTNSIETQNIMKLCIATLHDDTRY